tara:strand:- start:66 stop:947 length:882 start_codon:yes stop_codon:yes gene_type:complete
MTVSEMHNAVRILADKIDSLNFVNIETVEIDFFLNKEMERFIKHRTGGANAGDKGFEETQKRMDDLRNITKNAILLPDPVSIDNKPNGRFVTLPSAVGDTYWFSINEEANVRVEACNSPIVASGSIVTGVTYLVTMGTITYNAVSYSAGETFVGFTGQVGEDDFDVIEYSGEGIVRSTELKRMEIKPLQHDDYNKTIKDPFNKPVISGQFNQLRRLQLDGSVELLLPAGSIFLEDYILRYIRKPVQISLTSSTDCELADHTHQEIVDMTVSSILETTESGRYQTNLNELNKLE